jgi:DedD protein
MEKKKVLLIAISVGVFLVIAIGAAIVAFNPRVTSSGQEVALQPVPAGEGNSPLEAPAVSSSEPSESAASETAAPVADSTESAQPDTSFHVDGASTSAPAKEPESGNVIAIQQPKAVAVPSAAPVGRARSSTPKKKASTASRPSEKQVEKPSRAVEKAPATSNYKNYWVQTGSFSAMGRAQNAVKTLGTQGMSAIIDNIDLKGKTYYRVRVGPYTSQEEAEYWLKLVKNIDGCKDSQIWRN